MAIIVKKDDRANAVVFQGSSFATYWNGLLTAETGSDSSNTINIVNTAQTSGSTKVYEFYEVDYTDFADATGSAFADRDAAIAYINDTANEPADTGGFETNQSNFFIDGNPLVVTVGSGSDQAIFLTGSTNDFNTFVTEDIPVNIYNTSSGVMEFTHMLSSDVITCEVSYFVNSDVADASHEMFITFTDNVGTTFNKTVTQTQVDSADEDVEFLTVIPFYIGDNLKPHPDTAQTASGEIFFNPSEDADLKVKNITLYLNR